MNAIKSFLTQRRAGVTVLEYIVIGAIVLAVIVLIFAVIGPALQDKSADIAKTITDAGSH